MGLSSCFILLGSAFLYANCGITSLEGIYVFYKIEVASAFGEPISTIYSFGAKPEILSMGFLIMSVGYLFKVSAAPFHFWSPERRCGKSSIIGIKLPNSGDTLELLIPSSNRKIISGWINYSCMVISQKASEKNVGYRGSKSIVLNTIVKEQRVYGSWYGNPLLYLRCTLTGLERNYPVKIPSTLIIQRRLYSQGVSLITKHSINEIINPWFFTGFADAEWCFTITIRKSPKNNLGWQSFSTLTDPNLISNNNFVMNPWFITGFTDGEACFWIDVYKNNTYKTGWRVKLFYQINLHRKDQALLEQVQKFFNVGNIYNNPTASRYYVSSEKDLQIIIQHFDKYALLTKKRADFELLKQAFALVQSKEHLTTQGLEKILAIKASMNKGLSDELKANFPNIVPVERPVVENTVERDPNWLAGFTSAEGCFLIRTFKAGTKIGEAVKLVFQLTQHVRDEQLMRSFIDYFNCGNICKSRESFVYRVEKFSDIENKIIPFFNKYQIQGVKHLDYLDFCKAVDIIKVKGHTTKEGLEQIKEIKTGMNKGRTRK